MVVGIGGRAAVPFSAEKQGTFSGPGLYTHRLCLGSPVVPPLVKTPTFTPKNAKSRIEVNGSKLQMHRGNFSTFLATWQLRQGRLEVAAPERRTVGKKHEARVPDAQLGSKSEEVEQNEWTNGEI